MNLQSYAVWDSPTRLFQWINLACVVALAAIGTAILYDKELGVTDGGKIVLKTTHVWFGYVFAVNLAWRIAWAFIGNRHATWSAILPFHTGYGAAFKTYLRELIRGDVRPYLGHNPIARVMITIFLVLLMLQAVTGLVLAGTDISTTHRSVIGLPAGLRLPGSILRQLPPTTRLASIQYRGRLCAHSARHL